MSRVRFQRGSSPPEIDSKRGAQPSHYAELVEAVLADPGEWYYIETSKPSARFAVRSAIATALVEIRTRRDLDRIYLRIRPEYVDDDTNEQARRI